MTPREREEVAGGVRRKRVGLVVQRYGVDIAGGSESLARALAERLVEGYDVTVLTTCARDYVTWRNELDEGTERVLTHAWETTRPERLNRG